MADVLPDNQRDHDAVVGSVVKKEDDANESNQTPTESNTSVEDPEEMEEDVDADADAEAHRRLTWIGEGLLTGQGLEAVEQFMHLPSVPKEVGSPSSSPDPKKAPRERTHSKLLDFLAKEESYDPNKPLIPEVAPVSAPLPSRSSGPETPTEERRQNKLLDFLATDVGERYLDDVYADEDREDDSENATPEHTRTSETTSPQSNNKLLEFLARESGERVHEVEKVMRAEPYTVPIRIETQETVAAALAESEATEKRTVSPEPTPEATPTAMEMDDQADERPASRNPVADFINSMEQSRPKFVIFNPDDLVSSSSSEGEDSGSPTATSKQELRLKKRSQQSGNRVRFANPGLDMQSGVVRQAVTDRYGREELLDFVAQVDEKSGAAREIIQEPKPRTPSPAPEPPVQRQPSPPVRKPSPPTRQESPPRKPDGRIASFLRKFSSKSKSGSDSGGSRDNSRSNSPELENGNRNSAPVQPVAPKPEAPVPRSGMSMFLGRTSIGSEPETTTPLETKLGGSSIFAPSPRSVLSNSDGDPTSKRMILLSTLRQLLEDCEKNELSDISMVRISILLSTVNQIVREDLRKERPAQGIMRRLSMHLPAAQQQNGVPASWVRSEKEKEEYERGHTVTTADIAHQVVKKSSSPEPRAPSPGLSLVQVEEPVAEDAMTAFTQFETAQNFMETLDAFDKLLHDCALNEVAARQPLRVYNHVKSALYTQFSFRQKQLFRLLDAKLSVDVYRRQPCLHKRVCIVGAGPVGMRAAVELAMLGAQVVVIDKRKVFSRENILHLWPWVVQDLTSLGAKVFFPQFCHSSAYFHVGTRQLQCILLKVALLLGVKVYGGTSFEGLAAPDSIVSERKGFYTVVTKPQIPWMEFTAVLGACGTKDKVAPHAGIKRFVFSRKEAIGLVCYFPNLGTNEEKKVKEFSWTIQFKQRMFAKMREIGIDLENVVYYRGEYHYIVMTPKRNNLLQQGVLKINYPIVSDLVAVDNIDPGALNDYVSRIINFFEIPQKSEFARVRLFDFSTRTRAAQAANVLSSRGKKLYVGLIGDALMEPFWPEGLGTCRGFLSAMDACWMVSQIGKQSDEQILADRELGYRIVQHISGFQRDDLQKNVRKYNVDPTSRYTVAYPATITY